MDDVEGDVLAAMRLARMDGDESPDVWLLLRRLGIRVVRAKPHEMVGRQPAQLAMWSGQTVIRIRGGLGEAWERFVLGHEAYHALCRRWGRALDAAEEARADYAAAAMLLPREPLERTWRRGADLRDVLERWPHVGPTCCALRVGELGLAGAVVTEGRQVRYLRAMTEAPRGVLDVAGEASRDGLADRPGFARGYRLTDGKRRAAVMLAA